LMGLVCAISGLTALAFLQASDPNLGSGYELFAIASAIIGGAVLSGGKGSIIGAIIGALIIAVINNGVVILGINMYWNSTVTGTVIITAVAIDYFIKRRNRTT
jgi:ribose transport system permease protein